MRRGRRGAAGLGWLVPLLALAGILTGASRCLADPNQVLYELGECCGRQTREIFSKDWRDGQFIKTNDGTLVQADFENHFNAALNKCFYLLTANYTIPKGSSFIHATWIILTDVNDNHEVGQLYWYDNRVARCVVRQDSGERTICVSEDQWRALIRPYMER